MANYAIVKDGVIDNIVLWDGDTSKWQPPTGTTAVVLGKHTVGTKFNGEPSPNVEVEWGIGDLYDGTNFSEAPDTRSTDQKWADLREYRNKELEKSDWMATGDRTQSDAEKTYRQALRDLPSNTSDPANFTLPNRP